MNNRNYAAAHASLRFSAKRFEQSPYLGKYECDELLFGLYARRFYPLSLGQDPVEQYWKLRRGVMLYDVPEKPLEIKGPDALALLEKVFTRRISDLKLWRARYAIACTPQGGIVMDGVLIRLAEDHFYYVTADGDFEQWLLAHSAGLEVEINDPKSRVLQIQGPKSLDLLRDAVVELPEPFGYFHAGMLDFGGQKMLTSRTGWTGELGFEIYSVGATTDHSALWDHLVEVGKPYGMQFSSAESMGIRRIEAGILDYGTDIDMQMTPYDAGLGAFVDLNKEDFVGRSALLDADQSCALFGLKCADAAPLSGLGVWEAGNRVGTMTTGAWTPYLNTGVGFVRFQQGGDWLGRSVTLIDKDANEHACEVVELPFYDAKKEIPRGVTVASDIG